MKIPWGQRYKELSAMVVEHGHCDQTHMENISQELATWINNQRAYFRNDQLSSERETLLNSISFIWDISDYLWMKKFNELAEFNKKHGHCQVPSTGEYNQLNRWLMYQRRLYRKSNLIEDRAQLLLKEGFSLVGDDHQMVWPYRYKELCALVAKHGHCDHTHMENISQELAAWINNQRAYFRNDQLSSERETLLNSISFIWDISDYLWMKKFNELAEFNKKHGHCQVPSTGEYKKFHNWITAQRVAYKKNKLNEDYVLLLQKIGFNFEPRRSSGGLSTHPLYDKWRFMKHRGLTGVFICEVWKNDLLAFVKWAKNIGWTKDQPCELMMIDKVRGYRPDNCFFQNYSKYFGVTKYTDVSLNLKWKAGFFLQQKYNALGYYENEIDAAKVTDSYVLEYSLNKPVNFKDSVSNWDEYYNELLVFNKEHGHSAIFKRYQPNLALGEWANRVRAAYKHKHINTQHINKLQQLGFIWDDADANWLFRLNELIIFKNQYNHCNVPCSYTKNLELARWLAAQRHLYGIGGLKRERVNKLEEIGVIWSPVIIAWQTRFSELVNFKKNHNHCNVPGNFSANPQLSLWVHTQRGAKRQGTLLKERERLLLELGFTWNIKRDEKNEFYNDLLTFREKFGHCNVSKTYLDNPKLGERVSRLRVRRKKDQLNQDYINKLDAIGFDWDPYETTWNLSFDELARFKATYGHCDVPKDSPGVVNLAAWVAWQRFYGNKNKLSPVRKERLDSIDFIWDKIQYRQKTA